MHAACRGGLDCRLGAGHGEERTLNMPSMFVTLDVSKLSGWLNADADCRAKRGTIRRIEDRCEQGDGRGEARRRRKRFAGGRAQLGTERMARAGRT